MANCVVIVNKKIFPRPGNKRSPLELSWKNGFKNFRNGVYGSLRNELVANKPTPPIEITP